MHLSCSVFNICVTIGVKLTKSVSKRADKKYHDMTEENSNLKMTECKVLKYDTIYN